MERGGPDSDRRRSLVLAQAGWVGNTLLAGQGSGALPVLLCFGSKKVPLCVKSTHSHVCGVVNHTYLSKGLLCGVSIEGGRVNWPFSVPQPGHGHRRCARRQQERGKSRQRASRCCCRLSWQGRVRDYGFYLVKDAVQAPPVKRKESPLRPVGRGPFRERESPRANLQRPCWSRGAKRTPGWSPLLFWSPLRSAPFNPFACFPCTAHHAEPDWPNTASQRHPSLSVCRLGPF